MADTGSATLLELYSLQKLIISERKNRRKRLSIILLMIFKSSFSEASIFFKSMQLCHKMKAKHSTLFNSRKQTTKRCSKTYNKVSDRKINIVATFRAIDSTDINTVLKSMQKSRKIFVKLGVFNLLYLTTQH